MGESDSKFHSLRRGRASAAVTDFRSGCPLRPHACRAAIGLCLSVAAAWLFGAGAGAAGLCRERRQPNT